MKSTPFLEYILYDIFGESEPITARQMMGAHILYYEGKAFAIVEKEELYLKGSKEIMNWYLDNGGKQFTYTKEGKDTHLYYFKVPDRVLEERSAFGEWMDMALTVAKLPKKAKI